MKELYDVAAERNTLVCSINNKEAFLDIDYLVKPQSFTDEVNQTVFTIIKSIYDEQEKLNSIDLPIIRSKAQELKLNHIVEDPDNLNYIRNLFKFNVDDNNVLRYAGIIRKLEYARLAYDQCSFAQEDLLNVKGTESIDYIQSILEKRVTDLSLMMDADAGERTVKLGDGLDEYFEYLVSNPVDIIGISTGMPLFDKYIGGLRRKCVVVIGARTGVGKCLRIGTKVLKHNGKTEVVEKIKKGDALMGPDSKPRNVLSTTNGYGKIYKITPVKGDPYFVNEDHVLSLKNTTTKQIKNICVKDYLTISNKQKHLLKGWRSETINWEYKPNLIPPYILGVWLGDGTSRYPEVTSENEEIIKELQEYSKTNSLDCKLTKISIRKKGGENTFLRHMQSMLLILNKHIPKDYLVNDEQSRLELLAGLIDTDGHLCQGCYEITTKYPKLSDGILFLARSLGFSAYSSLQEKKCQTGGGGIYSRIHIGGDIERIPVRIPYKKAPPRKQIKNVLHTGIKVEYVGYGEYYGFELDGDHLFLLGDFTVTHNSMISDNIAMHIVQKPKIPVLYLDTEMDMEGHWHRIMAMCSGVPINLIETGKFSLNDMSYSQVKKAKEIMEAVPYYYRNISGKPFEETLSFARRWIRKEVGVDSNGRTNDCVIIYDYLKLMSGEGINNDMKEYQALGFQTTDLHNFAVKHDVPILTSVQLNRDGITKEGTDAISQSDRIGWLASAVALYKVKSDEELQDSYEQGDRKLIIVKSRYGSTHLPNQYINIKFEGAIGRITEGENSTSVVKKEKSENDKPRKRTQEKSESLNDDENTTKREAKYTF